VWPLPLCDTLDGPTWSVSQECSERSSTMVSSNAGSVKALLNFALSGCARDKSNCPAAAGGATSRLALRARN
jgi:hypothetical protein